MRNLKKIITSLKTTPYTFIYTDKPLNTEFFKGIIAGGSIDDYQSNIIKKHENTITQREIVFKDYLEITNFHAEPVLLTYKPTQNIKDIIDQNLSKRPEYEFTTTDKKVHELWIVDQTSDISGIMDEMESINKVYIADGHHRIASSQLYNQNKKDNFLSNYFLSFFIDQQELKIFEYNRIVKDISPLGEEEFLNKLGLNFKITPLKVHQAPSSKLELSIYLNNSWYLIKVKSEKIKDDFKSQLNSQMVSDLIFNEIFNIKNISKNNNIEYIKGNQPIDLLIRKVNNYKNSLGIELFPHEIREITTIADRGETMPPKSTWIEPKLRSGLTIYEY